MPTIVLRVTPSENPDGGTRMAVETTFPTPEAMGQILSMGMEEGMASAMSQIDGIL